jgi:hypothetical protein
MIHSNSDILRFIPGLKNESYNYTIQWIAFNFLEHILLLLQDAMYLFETRGD